MASFVTPVQAPNPCSRPRIEICSRRTTRMTGDQPQRKLPNPLKAAVVAAALAAMQVTTSEIASAVGLGVQEDPVRISSFTNDVDVPRLPIRWEVHSQGCDTETFVVVANESEKTVDLLWINYEGKEIQYATILPGRIHLQPSYATHPWVVRDHATQNQVLFVMAQKDPAIAVLSGEGPDARASEDDIFNNPLKYAVAMFDK